MATTYPLKIDTTLTLPKVTDNVSPIVADDHNRLRDTIVAVETELGINPSGTYGTVKDRLDAIEVFTLDGYYGTTTIGEPEDGTYTDGLFKDFTSTTLIGTAIDRFNEVLASLTPSPAPDLSDISFTSALGVEGKVSFGASNAIVGYTNVGTDDGGSALNINGTFTTGSGTTVRKGVVNSSTTVSGVIADAVVADTGTPTPAYPDNAFGNADSGNLQLELNGSVIHTTNLAVFGSGNSLNGNGSGFNLIAAEPVKFPNGNPLTLFYYRTGTWTVDPADMRNGFNYVRIIHAGSYITNYFSWVVDDNATATSFSGETLAAPSMTGSKYISGVEYHTGGTANYSITIDNLHRNTYSSSASAVTHPGASNVSISSASLGSITTEADSEIISGKVATINANRILNGSIAVNTRIDRTVQSDLTSSGVSQSGLLLDNVTDDSANTNQTFNGEQFRVPSNRSLTDTTNLNSGGNGTLWDETISLVSATAGYSDGLQFYNSTLVYPTIDFSSISQGPAGNVDYSVATGTRTCWMYFYVGGSAQNFRLNVTQSGVTFISAASALGTGNGNAHLELLAPNTTVNGGATVEFKDCVTAYISDTAIGCYASTYGSTIPTNWGITLGTKSTATSGSAIILRVTVGQGWTGSISNISVTVL